ncbi:hypothetical protein P5673_001691 [Acropora cervicornis]|uniref:Uncharacterized protein n=1 Tax=Acropora cervicornis TaxID=6130 RepID=A0AAD9R446_ACRCE|nr:hypothetical protein P5673_001691 [Acropora cervicornis]
MDGECLSVTVVERVAKSDTLGGYVFLVFLLCLVVGFILGLLLARYVLRQLEEQYSTRRSKSHSAAIVLENDYEELEKKTESPKKLGSNRIGPMSIPSKNTVEMEPTHGSAASVCSQAEWTEKDSNDQEEMEVVLQNQDFRSIEIMETNLQFHRNETFLQLLKMILSFLVSKSRITDKFKRDLLAKYEQGLEDINKNAKEEMKAEEQTSERLELQDNLKADLVQNTELSEEEAEQIVTKLMMNMLAVNKRLAEEQNRQAMVLHERLAQRQALAQLRVAVNQQAFKNIDVVCKKGKLLEDQKERIMDEYRRDLRVLEEKHQQAVLKSQNDLSERLKKKREQQMKKLQMEQAVEKDEFDRKAGQLLMEGNMTVEGFLEATHKLNELVEKRQQSLREREEVLFEHIRKEADLSKKEAERLMNNHLEDLKELNERKRREREKQRAMIQEKLQERKQRKEREMEQQGVEQSRMVEEQEKAIKQVLNTQAGLAEELRKQVMMEHDQNMVALNNHLQMTRLRQQKRLEKRLASRRARLVELTQQMEKERENQDKNDPEAMKTLSRGQNIEYQAEVKKIEVEHQAALEALRRRLETETDEALKEQDERLGKILGKLQKKVVESMTRKGTLTDFHTNRLLKQHHKQVDNLNAQIEMDKEKQMQKIREKIEAKQLKKTRSALRIISISLAEQRHKRALEEEERKFIATLAENSSAGEEELLQTIKSSASEVGLDSKLTKSITKDVRKRVRSARTPAPDV